VGEEQEMWGGGGMWVRSDVTSGRNRRWEGHPDTGDAEDGKTTSDASGRGALASDAGLIFADVPGRRKSNHSELSQRLRQSTYEQVRFKGRNLASSTSP